MAKIKLNDTQFNLLGYSKNTYFNQESISSNATCNVSLADIDVLNELAEDTITSIQIYNNENTLIYNLDNINARIESLNEYLNGDRIDINVNLIFSFE